MKARGLLLDGHAGGVERRHDESQSMSQSALFSDGFEIAVSDFRNPRRNDHDRRGDAAHDKVAAAASKGWKRLSSVVGAEARPAIATAAAARANSHSRYGWAKQRR
jgi:hypothetical protein